MTGNFNLYQNFISKLKNFELSKNILTIEIKNYVQDTTQPLDERWNIFITSNLGEDESWYLDLQSYDLENFYSDWNISRHRCVDVSDIIDYLTDLEVNSEIINNVKEEILKLFIKSFTYDW